MIKPQPPTLFQLFTNDQMKDSLPLNPVSTRNSLHQKIQQFGNRRQKHQSTAKGPLRITQQSLQKENYVDVRWNAQSLWDKNRQDDEDYHTLQKQLPSLNLNDKPKQVSNFVESQTGKFATSQRSQRSQNYFDQDIPTSSMFTTTDLLPSQHEIKQLKDMLIDGSDYQINDATYLLELQLLASIIMFRTNENENQ